MPGAGRSRFAQAERGGRAGCQLGGGPRRLPIKFTKQDGKLKGVLTGRNRDREVKKIEIKDNQLTFEISGENDGNQWSVTYKAKPRGNSVKGTIDYDFGGNSGTIDFEGKRLPEKEKQEGA